MKIPCASLYAFPSVRREVEIAFSLTFKNIGLTLSSHPEKIAIYLPEHEGRRCHVCRLYFVKKLSMPGPDALDPHNPHAAFSRWLSVIAIVQKLIEFS